MTDTALVTMTITLGVVWGGFALLLFYALRRESHKAKQEPRD